MSETRDETTLIERFRSGDHGAFLELFDPCVPTLEGRMRRMLPAGLARKVSVADLLQEVRLAAFETRARFEDRGPHAFRRWVLGIADNQARKALAHFRWTKKRALAREVTRGARPDTEQAVARTPTPSEVAIAAEALEIVRRAMAALPPDYQEILRLIREECLTTAQAGARMGRSREAAKKLYARALYRFTEEYRRQGGSHDG